MRFAQSERDNTTGITNINTIQTALNSGFRVRIGSSHQVWGQFSLAKFEYNTPDEGDNAEDRDEQRFIIDLGYRKQFSPDLLLFIKSNVYLFHQVYLRPGRSQNNNWNRIFQLSSAVQHRVTDRITHQSEAKILANYTVFDFEDLLPTLNSFVFRKLVYSDSLRIQLSQKLSYHQIIQIESEDNGLFFRKLFAQQITKSLNSQFYNAFIRYRWLDRLLISAGMTYFVRDEWQHNVERIKVRNFTTISPRFSVSVPASQSIMLLLSYSPNYSRNRFRVFTASEFTSTTQEYTTAQMMVKYRF